MPCKQIVKGSELPKPGAPDPEARAPRRAEEPPEPRLSVEPERGADMISVVITTITILILLLITNIPTNNTTN